MAVFFRPYSARFIADENTPDGTVMRPGEVFRKSWILLNDGSLPWGDDEVQLVCLTETMETLGSPRIPITAPHDRTTISVDLKCPERAGVYESKWIFSYRNKTFGPMIWCSIEVSPREQFEVLDVPLPDCFDLSKPFRQPANAAPEPLINSKTKEKWKKPKKLFVSFLVEAETNSTVLDSISSIESNSAPILQPIRVATPPSPRAKCVLPFFSTNFPSFFFSPPLHFVDAVVTNIFSVAKQAGSTAKAIFNTLQATEGGATARSTDDVFEHLEPPRQFSNEPMDLLVDMGFVDREKNQRLLNENHQDLTKVIELLSFENDPTADWFFNSV